MKAFINQTLAFFALTVIYLLANFSINYHRLTDPINLTESTLVMGDSHLMSSVDPTILPNSANICSGAESYLMTYYKLKKILKSNPHVSQILLGFSYNNFSAYQDLRLSGNRAKSQFSRYYEILPIDLPQHVEVNDSKFYHTYIRELALYPNFSESKFLGGFQKHKSGLDKADLNETLQKHYYPLNNFVGVSKYASVYLDSIINLSQQKNIKLVLVSSPLHNKYSAQTPIQIKNYFDSLKLDLTKRQITVLNFLEYPYEDRLFKDYDHLSHEGARDFTAMLTDKLSIN